MPLSTHLCIPVHIWNMHGVHGCLLSKKRFWVPLPPSLTSTSILVLFGCSIRIPRLAIYNEQTSIKLVVLRAGKPLMREPQVVGTSLLYHSLGRRGAKGEGSGGGESKHLCNKSTPTTEVCFADCRLKPSDSSLETPRVPPSPAPAGALAHTVCLRAPQQHVGSA